MIEAAEMKHLEDLKADIDLYRERAGLEKMA